MSSHTHTQSLRLYPGAITFHNIVAAIFRDKCDTMRYLAILVFAYKMASYSLKAYIAHKIRCAACGRWLFCLFAFVVY